jgi:hypothetical protein
MNNKIGLIYNHIDCDIIPLICTVDVSTQILHQVNPQTITCIWNGVLVQLNTHVRDNVASLIEDELIRQLRKNPKSKTISAKRTRKI